MTQGYRTGLAGINGAASRRTPIAENFAREVMELFTMGVGHYTERDVRKAARAFTGWYFDNLDFARRVCC